MKYLIDTNNLIENIHKYKEEDMDFFITEDVRDEYVSSFQRASRLKEANIEIVEFKSWHLERLKEVMAKHGTNTDFIDMFSGKGNADTTLVAYALEENENQESLFPEEWVIITKDKGLTGVAKSYGIKVFGNI